MQKSIWPPNVSTRQGVKESLPQRCSRTRGWKLISSDGTESLCFSYLSDQNHNPSSHEGHFTRTLPSLEVSLGLFVPLLFNVHASVSTITHLRSASMTQLSLVFQILCLCLVSVSKAIPAAEPSLVKRAVPPQSTACGDVVNSQGTYLSKGHISG